MSAENGKIAVIDYGAGNLYSVLCALKRAAAPVYVAKTPSELSGCAGMVLPGVGAFGYAAESLKESGFYANVKEKISGGTPILGICLGMQLLFSSSEESVGATGLGILTGKVLKLKTGSIKSPHMGWTSLTDCKGELMRGVKDGDFVYFVHSYAVFSEGCACARAKYGETFDAAVERGNVFATQFHPEKSSSVGHTILVNFLNYCYGRAEA